LIQSITLAILCVFFYKRFGFLASLTSATLLAFSPWIANFAFSLYWTSFLLFVPFIICWLAYPLFLDRESFRPLFIAAIALSVGVKSLCGYEYITNVILSCVIPIFFYHLQRKSSNKELIKNVAIVVGAGILGFVSAVALHCLQISWIFDTNGLAVIADRASDRTVSTVGTDHQQIINTWMANLPEDSWLTRVMQNPWLPSVTTFGILGFFRYFTFPAVEIPFANASLPIGLFALASLCLLAFSCFKLVRFSTLEKNLILSANLGLLVSLSWQVLAFNHMSVHFHLNGIVYYVPFLVMMYLLTGVLLKRTLVPLERKTSFIRNRSRIAIYFLASILFVLSVVLPVRLIAQQQAIDVAEAQEAVVSIPSNALQLQGYVDGINVYDRGSDKTFSNITYEIVRTPFINGNTVRVIEISGWAVDLDNPQRPVELSVAYDGILLETKSQYFNRDDVSSALNVSTTEAGFVLQSFVVDASQTVDTAKIQVYAIATKGRIQLPTLD
jgi:hypothetical protein